MKDKRFKILFDHSSGGLLDMDVTFVGCHLPKQNNHKSVGKVILSLLLQYILYGAPIKARNVTSYIYMDEIFYWGFCFLNRAFR
jgi:hypothetical protein